MNEGFNTFLGGLTAASAPAGTEVIPSLQGGGTKGMTPSQIAALSPQFTSGTGAPSGGKNGDWYLNLTTLRLYLNESGIWTNIGQLVPA